MPESNRPGRGDATALAATADRTPPSSGISAAYLATDRELGVITEISSGTPNADLKPDATHP